MKILKATTDNSAYQIATEEFAKLYTAITGRQIQITDEDDNQSDLVVLGGEEVNRFSFNYILNKHIKGFEVAICTDEFRILSAELNGRKLLFLVGGSGRATIYAVYHYFEKIMNCRWFWDGDIIPKAVEINLSKIDIKEKPRFKYRGLRYFAHRALHRFQAEHWDFEDWKKEIDWLMKKKLNLFMLRTGNDDIFQKAFPELVDYPENNGKFMENAPGYTDRTTAWSLKYRGELRKKILDYAFERELIHPEDCGTMTHWYSPTPQQFIEKAKPTFLTESSAYTEDINRQVLGVWDVREKRNQDFYFKLTDTHIKEYGRPDMFHTIGLAERNFSADPETNFFIKKYVYKVILSNLKKKYPNAPVLIASWDLWMFFTPEEMEQLLKEFNPEQAIIFDYTSDTSAERNFTKWNVVGKYPYIFGMFLGYSRNSDIRNNFELTEQRLKIAAEDEFCKGFVLWPELSHSSTFMTEYLADNAWSPLSVDFSERIVKYCRDRYLYSTAELTEIWQSFMPIASLMSWSMGDGRWDPIYNTGELFFRPFDAIEELKKGVDSAHNFDTEKAKALIPNAVSVLESITALDDATLGDKFIRRDAFDIARTVIGRYIYLLLLTAINEFKSWQKGEEINNSFYTSFENGIKLLSLLCDLLGEHEDYSMLASFKRLETVSEVNPVFEDTLKRNASNDYHRSFVFENAKYLYLPEIQMVYDWFKANLQSGNREVLLDEAPYLEQRKENFKSYFATSLKEMGSHKSKDFKEILNSSAKILKEIM